MSRNKMKKDHALGIDWGVFYRTVIALVVPMALQNLINVGVTRRTSSCSGPWERRRCRAHPWPVRCSNIRTLFLFG